MSYLLLTLILVCGVLLAFPAAICISALLGYILMTWERKRTPCPSCGAYALRWLDGIRETYPTGRGTGNLYECEVCHHRAWWSNDDQQWQQPSGRFNHSLDGK